MAWGHLVHRAGSADGKLPGVHRFVTLGSPVGSAEVRQIVFGVQNPLALPNGVASWVNVIDDDDPFAAPLFRDPNGGVATSPVAHTGTGGGIMSDVVTSTRRSDAHDLRGYLRDPAATHAILGAWCDAMRREATSATACATLTLTSPTALAR
jgi:hypothetical protein